MNTHANILYNAQSTRDWMQLTPESKVLGLAPLFHITGLICQLMTSLVVPAALILSYRFDPEIMLSSIREYGPTFAIGAVTAFVGILAAERRFLPQALKDREFYGELSLGGALRETRKLLPALIPGPSPAPWELSS